MKKSIDIISLTVLNGNFSTTEKRVLENGKIIGISIYKNGVNNTGFVRGSLKDKSGFEIVPLSHIDNFRNREANYNHGFIPLNINGGEQYQVDIVADTAFNADTNFEALFHYDVTQTC